MHRGRRFGLHREARQRRPTFVPVTRVVVPSRSPLTKGTLPVTCSLTGHGCPNNLEPASDSPLFQRAAKSPCAHQLQGIKTWRNHALAPSKEQKQTFSL